MNGITYVHDDFFQCCGAYECVISFAHNIGNLREKRVYATTHEIVTARRLLEAGSLME